MYDSGGQEILDEHECRELLGTTPLGRVVFTDRALPAIQPVNFALCREDVVIRTSDGSKLAAATRNAVVAFEVDEFDLDSAICDGWSVVIIGHAASSPKRRSSRACGVSRCGVAVGRTRLLHRHHAGSDLRTPRIQDGLRTEPPGGAAITTQRNVVLIRWEGATLNSFTGCSAVW